MGKGRIMTAREKAIRTAREWEFKNVWGAGHFKKKRSDDRNLKDSVRTQGYDVVRVSNRPVTKFGNKYYKVQAATVSPNYKYGTQGNYHPTIEWHNNGYVKANKNTKKGTQLLHSMSSYPIDKKILKSRLGIKTPRKKSGRRKKPRRK